MSIYRYPIAVEKPLNGEAFGVAFPDVAGCYSAGDTLDEAIENAKDALAGYLESCCLDGDPIPEPGDLSQHVKDENYKDYIWSFVEMDLTPYLGKSKKINVTLPEYLIKKIDAVANTNPNYKTRSGFLAAAAEHELKVAR